MNLTLMKEKEDLQQEFNKLYQPIRDFKENRKLNCIQEVKNTFIQFCENQGFKVRSESNDLIANYKNINIILKKPDEQESRMGCNLFFTLIFNETTCNIPVIFSADKKFKLLGSHSYISQSPEDKLKNEIKYLKEDIEYLPEYFENIKTEKIRYGFSIGNNRQTNYEYATFSEVLEKIFS